MEQGGRAAVFLDRDGTIIEERGYLSRPEQVSLIPRAGEAIARLNQSGLAVVMVSNQSGLARGMFSEQDLAAVQQEMLSQLAQCQARLDGLYFCPHLPEGSVARYAIACECRKPLPGMLLKAAGSLGLDLGASFMVGDRLLDVACGRMAGLRTVLVATGMDDGPPQTLHEQPHFIAADLAQAVDWILAQPGRLG